MNIVFRLHLLTVVTTLTAIAVAFSLAGCGGGDAADDGLEVVGPVTMPYCPPDPGTFVGPLPVECLTGKGR